jgi:hypothetical protein
MRAFRKSSISANRRPYGRRRFEHWYRDNTVYFITARCRGKFPAFESEAAKEIFWDRFTHYSDQYGFVPFVTSLMDNHYHSLGYLKTGENLGPLMRHLHGSVAKLVNDLLPGPLKPFWFDAGKQGYFDGCIRDEMQCRRAFRYTLTQSVRHGICPDWRGYRHTRINIDVDKAVKRAIQLKAFMTGVPYRRYLHPPG